MASFEKNPYVDPTIPSTALSPGDPEMDVLVDIPDSEMMGMPTEDEEGMEVDVPVPGFTENLADRMEEDTLDKLGKDLLAAVAADDQSQSDWKDIFQDGLKLLGFTLGNVEEEVFPDSCTAFHPVLAESIVKYQAKARSQILRPDGVARSKILGKTTPEKKAQAERVAQFLNYQVMEQMPEYGPEHDKMLFHQAFGGDGITKIYYDSLLKRPVSRCVKPTQFIIDYEASDLESAHRYTEAIPITGNDLKRYQLDGFYRQVDLTEKDKGKKSQIEEEIDRIQGRSVSTADDENYTLYEVHTYLALEGEVDDRNPEEQEIGLELPYVITLDSQSGKVLSIRRNWKEGDLQRSKRVWYTHWVFIPGFGFRGFGYIHLIGGLARTATSSMRQLIDSGSFATLQGGFKVHGLRVVGNNEPITPGEWRDVQAPGMDLTKALHPLPYKEPSGTLMALLEFVVVAAQKFADSTEQVVSESTNYGPVGTTLALLEASGRLFSGIHERLFQAQKRELYILMEINSETLTSQYPYDVVGPAPQVAATDFDARLDVIPATDPREPTAAHRVARANATLSVAQQFPDLHNLPAVLEDLHTALGSEDAQRYLKQTVKPYTGEPVSENEFLLRGMPVKSELAQDHVSHVQVHMVLMENDLYKQNPTVVAAVMAHVQDHLAHNFRTEMVAAGVPVPPEGQQVPPEQAAMIAKAAAQAVSKIKATIGPAGDPEVQIKAAEQQRKSVETRMKYVDMKRQEKLARDKMAQDERFHRDEVALKKREISVKAATDLIGTKTKAKTDANKRNSSPRR